MEQQEAKRRIKRDFSLPTDPLWNAQWYLVGHPSTSKLYCNTVSVVFTEQRWQIKQRHECPMGLGARSNRKRSGNNYFG